MVIAFGKKQKIGKSAPMDYIYAPISRNTFLFDMPISAYTVTYMYRVSSSVSRLLQAYVYMYVMQLKPITGLLDVWSSPDLNKI